MPIVHNILVATDLEQASRAAVELAFDFASALSSRVHVVHVLSLPGVQNLSALPAQVVADAESSAARGLEALIEPYRKRAQVGEVKVCSGSPVDVIVQTATAVAADLIVVGTHNRRGLARVLGSVAAGVVRNAGIPVMVVPPRAEQAS